MPNYEELKALLEGTGGVVIGYSGGVDSTLLAKVATDALGEGAVSVLLDSCLIPRSEIEEAVTQARDLGLNLVRVEVDALSVDDVPDNEPDRCYHCKKALFSLIADIARERGITTVADGANADDASDYRPGTKATAELGVRSPLKELGFTKQQVRDLSRELGLPTWDRPSYACLASRVPYGTPLDADTLLRIEKSEAVLRKIGFAQCRVRHHGDIARIEIPTREMDLMIRPETRGVVLRELKAIGYRYVSLDLGGYRTGSMNEALGDG